MQLADYISHLPYLPLSECLQTTVATGFTLFTGTFNYDPFRKGHPGRGCHQNRNPLYWAENWPLISGEALKGKSLPYENVVPVHVFSGLSFNNDTLADLYQFRLGHDSFRNEWRDPDHKFSQLIDFAMDSMKLIPPEVEHYAWTSVWGENRGIQGQVYVSLDHHTRNGQYKGDLHLNPDAPLLYLP